MRPFANVDDTLIGHHAFASHRPHRLDQVVSEYCDAGPWKLAHGMRNAGDKGEAIGIMSGEELALYNGQDARLTALSWERMGQDLAAERVTYETDIRLARLCHEMTWAGIGVDEARRQAIGMALNTRLDECRAECRSAAGSADGDPAKLAWVREMLVDWFRAPITRTTEKGQVSTNDETLEELIGPGGDTPLVRFAESLLEYRLVAKVLSTYIDAAKPYPDGRAHYGWKPFGTVSGRLAGRLQSCPRYSPQTKEGRPTPEGRVREIYVPAPGHRFVYFDVSQAEMRLAAYLSADPVFMSIASTSDVHSGNAKMVFPALVTPGAPEFGWLDDKEAKVDPKRGKPFRDIAKNLGFAICYGAKEDRVYATLRRKGFGVTMPGIRHVLHNLRKAYRVYYAWVEANVERVRVDGFMRSPVQGRIRWLGRYCPPTEVANFPVQSALADVMNRRMLALQDMIWAGVLPGVRAVAQIHDALICEAPIGEEARLEDTIRKQWEEPVGLLGGALVLPIDMKRGDRWSDLG